MTALERHPVQARARGFSLIELLITLAVVFTLSSLMFPTFSKVREMALRLMCQNNMRSIFTGLESFRNDHRDLMPESSYAPRQVPMTKLRPQQLMAMTTDEQDATGRYRWDGLGMLWHSEGSHYISDYHAFYCPAHGATHPVERYASVFERSSKTNPRTNEPVYANYHYWEPWNRAVASQPAGSLARGTHPIAQGVLLTDGMRTAPDFSHRFGCNALATEGSIFWIGGNRLETAVRQLPSRDEEVKPTEAQVRLFDRLISAIEPAR